MTSVEDPLTENKQLQEAKEFLRGVPGGGTSVYDHLTQVLVKILDERPPDANALFEEVSASVRDGALGDAVNFPTEKQLVRTCRRALTWRLGASGEREPRAQQRW